MNTTTPVEESEKAAMKRLREARKQTVVSVSARVREQKKAMEAITEQLRDHPMTVPEISGATGIPSADALWYVAALKKYGLVVEAGKDGGYFRYQMAENGSEPEAQSKLSAETRMDTDQERETRMDTDESR